MCVCVSFFSSKTNIATNSIASDHRQYINSSTANGITKLARDRTKHNNNNHYRCDHQGEEEKHRMRTLVDKLMSSMLQITHKIK